MNSKDTLSSDEFVNALSKVGKKNFPEFRGTNNTIMHKIDYATIFYSLVFIELNANKW